MKNEKSHNYGEHAIDRPVLAPLERQLMCAVLVKALQDATGNQKEIKREALHWFEEPEQEDSYAFSFLSICEILGINPEKIRGALKDKDNNLFKKVLRTRVDHTIKHPSQVRKMA